MIRQARPSAASATAFQPCASSSAISTRRWAGMCPRAGRDILRRRSVEPRVEMKARPVRSRGRRRGWPRRRLWRRRVRRRLRMMTRRSSLRTVSRRRWLMTRKSELGVDF
ncbi:hypothetical protein JI435_090430 [Parastagonospora nodorum SN15]|uniref:Uncharacterized protein n=1 Tax=Phaeosphaeria nodorum (strain SN15 / ATCC MYA-4574 / FGSC 10173) TaxID=321614 RepID=A0A7U2I3J3_PHANO|nr:hypothetical protein JI435_090430 [Parastagonospora nodorum SN15]